MRGRSIPISPARRSFIDVVRLSRGLPLVSVQRRMSLHRLVLARSQTAAKATWFAIFAKAYGLVGREFPELRRVYIKLPWPQFYEYSLPVALLPVSIRYGGEETTFGLTIEDPGGLSVAAIARRIVDTTTVPPERMPEFRCALRLVRLPWPIRAPLDWLAFNSARTRARYFGTFLVDDVSAHGVESQHILSPAPNSVSFGSISPDGDVDVRMYWDQRVMDSAVVARTLAQLERTLNGVVADEMVGATGPHSGET